MIADLRQAIILVRQKLDTSERRTCKTVGMTRSTQRYVDRPKDDDKLRLALIRLAKQYGRTDTAKSRSCCRQRDGILTTRKLKGFGVRKACNNQSGIKRRNAYIIKTVLSSAFALSIKNMFGPSTSCTTSFQTVRLIKC